MSPSPRVPFQLKLPKVSRQFSSQPLSGSILLRPASHPLTLSPHLRQLLLLPVSPPNLLLLQLLLLPPNLLPLQFQQPHLRLHLRLNQPRQPPLKRLLQLLSPLRQLLLLQLLPQLTTTRLPLITTTTTVPIIRLRISPGLIHSPLQPSSSLTAAFSHTICKLDSTFERDCTDLTPGPWLAVDMVRTLRRMVHPPATLTAWISHPSSVMLSLSNGTMASWRTSLGAKILHPPVVQNSCTPLKSSGSLAFKLDVLPLNVLLEPSSLNLPGILVSLAVPCINASR